MIKCKVNNMYKSLHTLYLNAMFLVRCRAVHNVPGGGYVLRYRHTHRAQHRRLHTGRVHHRQLDQLSGLPHTVLLDGCR